MKRMQRRLTPIILVLALCDACGAKDSRSTEARSTRYEDLVSLFGDWRDFQRPRVTDGVPDYAAPAMGTQHRDLAGLRQRLAGIDPSGWSVPQQVDYRIVEAEMNGLDFDHRVLKPWARNPAFYVTVFPEQSDQPAREGPFAFGGIELWSYRFPLSAEDAAKVQVGLRAIPKLLVQARANLVGDAHDLWVYGIRSIKQQSADLDALTTRVAGSTPNLEADIRTAKEATDRFASWLEAEAGTKKGPSGIGIENYDWYLRHVQLLPYTWQDEVTLIERELGRARAFLALEEVRNRALPELVPIASAEEHARKLNAAVTEYMRFLAERDLITIADYLEPALRERIGGFTPGPWEFFTEVDYRDPGIMRTHGYHWFDLARMTHEPHPDPIRRSPLLYNIFITRTEGLATGWEEMMLQAGMLDSRPRARELVYILVAQRAARALGDLMMHANRFTLEQAAKFAVENTPRGWLRETGRTVWGEQHLYLQQPTYGTSYVIGKMEIEELLSERVKRSGGEFTMKRFMDQFNAVGLIPISLVRWEMTGDPGHLAEARE